MGYYCVICGVHGEWAAITEAKQKQSGPDQSARTGEWVAERYKSDNAHGLGQRELIRAPVACSPRRTLPPILSCKGQTSFQCCLAFRLSWRAFTLLPHDDTPFAEKLVLYFIVLRYSDIGAALSCGTLLRTAKIYALKHYNTNISKIWL
eukprot:scaffold90928_cov36-Cyclotella_meneghiniana.AAC.9